MKRSFLLCLAVMAVALACLGPQNTFVSSAKSDKFKRSASPVPDRYIVVLEDQTRGRSPDFIDAKINEIASEYLGHVDKKFAHAIEGYSVEMTEAEAQRLSEDPRVKYVEEDGFVEPQAIQTNATWGISRIDQRSWQYPLSTEYEYNATGAGVNVYVIDSGILSSHPDFGGRVVDAFDAFNDPTSISQCSGHGTHVAGTVGSNTFGVAKNVTLYSVRVQPCSGYATTASVISGIDWINRNVRFPAVANMSLGSVYSQSFETAVKNSIALGITYTVSAGNDGTDACNYSPGHLPEAITVGSMGSSDSFDPSTNYGRCIDLFAPGVSIASTWNTALYPSFVLSGTSTAAPHAAGVAALYLEMNPSASPSQVQDALISNASTGAIYGLGNGSPNLLLFSNFVSGGGIPSVPSACSGTEFSGSIVTVGSSSFQSSSAGFNSRQGRISGALDVPENSSFRLHLEKKSSRRFTTVASSSGGGPQQTVEVLVKKGTYRWRIESLVNSGNYSLCSIVP